MIDMNNMPPEVIRMMLEPLSKQQRLGVERVSMLFRFLSSSFEYQEVSEEVQYFIENATKFELDSTFIERLNASISMDTSLENKNILLDEINASLIRKKIHIESSTLNISYMGITRFPSSLLQEVSLRSYWRSLKILSCNNNMLSQLPNLTNLTALQQLLCFHNQLTQLPDLSSLRTLHHLHCHNNQILQLPDLISLRELKYLICSYNQLIQLPDLTNLEVLHWLSCDNNQLSQLPDLTDLKTLQWLSCKNNRFSQLPPRLIAKFGNKWAAETLSSQTHLTTTLMFSNDSQNRDSSKRKHDNSLDLGDNKHLDNKAKGPSQNF